MVVWSTPAKLVIQKMVDATSKLSQFPHLGRIVPERGDDNLRELILYSYRLIYRIDGQTIYIVTILHGSQDADSRL